MTQVRHYSIWKYLNKTGDSGNVAVVAITLWFSILIAKKLQKDCLKEKLVCSRTGP